MTSGRPRLLLTNRYSRLIETSRWAAHLGIDEDDTIGWNGHHHTIPLYDNLTLRRQRDGELVRRPRAKP